MTDEERRIRKRLRDDFPHYAAKCLRIRTKADGVQPFVLNKAQSYVHERLESQRARTGRVRALICKGRQQGMSTYVGGRFYWQVTHRHGCRAYILTHEDQATQNLFEMTVRYHEHCNPLVKPVTGAANAKELSFPLLDSGYKVGTAGNKGAGRSQTVQLFLGSEVAYWPHAQDHAAGIMQAVPDQPGTEIVLESTANGIGNLYHSMWQAAEAGESEYEAIFVPWYWQPEYTKPVPEGFALTVDEAEYADAWQLTLGQMAWRRAKIAELGEDGETRFKAEYPACAAEAFQMSGGDVLIPAPIIMRARKTRITDPAGPLLIGVDPARFGDDRTAIIRRQGRRAFGVETMVKQDTMSIVGRVARLIDAEQPAKVFVDIGGLGAGIVDRLHELGHRTVVVGVNAGESPIDGERYVIKRDEMWGEMRDWLKDAPCEVPDTDEMHADLGSLTYTYDSKGRLKVESKVDARKRGIRSPDLADALGLTFAYPVAVSRKPFVRHRERILGGAR